MEKIEKKLLRDEEKRRKEEAKILRAEMRAEKKAQPKPAKTPQPEATEAEIVRRYVNRVIKNAGYHGRINTQKFGELAKEQTQSVNKDLWLDSDFYFCIVFESDVQKYTFLDALELRGLEIPSNRMRLTMINGLKLAEFMKISLKRETGHTYPLGQLDLQPFVLEDEGNDS